MQVLDNFESSYSKFLDARQSWDSLEALQANTDILMPNGFKVFCKEEAKWYILTATDEADPSTYTWNEDGGTDEEAISLASTAITMVGEVNEKAEEALATAATAIATANNSSASLTENITPNVEVGGIGVGDTLTTGQQMTDILKKLLVKYFEPVITLSADKALINKKGATIEAPITITATAEKKSNDVIFYSINYDGNDVSTGNNPDGGEITYIHQTDISTDTMFIGSISDGKSTVNKTIKFEFINPYYYGSVNDNEISDFTGLTEETVKKNINKKVSYTSSAEYLVFAYDATYGDLTSIKDKNNFENLPAFTKTVMEINGENYNVYISSDKITCSNFEYTFKI